ncbi:uncharacterized protein LOC124498888 isoform X2 [Dermatophagoides farinae]|uniref:uncharacterized protein LOC124498888 isoform X2 n=1 Tax=Dermatophagoides farinae TaxID=6954 RepID=UPI003F63399E
MKDDDGDEHQTFDSNHITGLYNTGANQFASVLVPVRECPRNCMLKAVTNPAGIVLKWKRLCAPEDDLTRGFSCRIDYVFGARIEQCTCDKDFCNHTESIIMKNPRYFHLLVLIILIIFISI